MDLQLKRIRIERGISQAEMAKKLGIKTSRYGTWERGERMMNLEQAFNCAVILGCTIDEIAGMPQRGGLSPDERELVGAYRDVTFPGKRAMMVNARAVRDEYVEKTIRVKFGKQAHR